MMFLSVSEKYGSTPVMTVNSGVVTTTLAAVALLTVLALGLLNPAHAEQITASEKRSMIQAVDGYSYLSEDKTISELRAAALNNAKQEALSNATTYIKSKTEVDNFVLKSDEVVINAEGTVKVLEKRDNGIKDNSRYHIWIKAEVEYLLGEGGLLQSEDKSSSSITTTEISQAETTITSVPPPVVLPSATAPLTVKIWSPKTSYKSGEKIEIYLKGNRDFYARIVDINDRGEIVQLLPNDFRQTSFFKGGKTYKIPDGSDQFDLTVSPPFGKDKIVVYASEVPLGQVAMNSIGMGLNSYGGDSKTLAVRTRGISVTSRKKATPVKASSDAVPAIAEFYEASYEIQTSR